MENTVKTAWIIDDDEIYKYGFRKFVTIKKFCKDIVEFSNGREAIDRFEKIVDETDLPDVIFLDIEMPVMNGWNFLRALRHIKFNKQIRIVMVTASVEYEEYMRAREFPEISDYVTKPIDTEQFSAIFYGATTVNR